MALDSTSCSGRKFKQFVDAIHFFQKKGIIPGRTSIASVYYSSLSPLPLEFYAKEKWKLADEAEIIIKNAATNHFDFESVKVLLSDSSTTEDHVAQISKFAKKYAHADFLIVGSNDRSGLPLWLLGSFSETAALTALLPVLIIKPYFHTLAFSRIPHFLITVDIAAMPSQAELSWIRSFASSVKARLQLVYVIPRIKPIIDSLQLRKNRYEAMKKLNELKSQLESIDIKVSVAVVDEEVSVGHTIAKVADKSKSWIIVTTSAKRRKIRRLLLGSRARQMLALTKRPFLSIRLD